jgi:hypothetical protein
MDLQNILQQLRQQRGQLDAAINALEGSATAPRRGRPPKTSQTSQAGAPNRRVMSAAARAKIAAAARARWARVKGQTGAKKSAPPTKRAGAAKKKAAERRGMSAAARKKLSALMKARWAARRKAA